MESIIDIQKTHKVLILGIGRSNIIDVLYSNGFKDIIAIDISPLVIAQMQEKYKKFSGVECINIILLFYLLYCFLYVKFYLFLIVYIMDARELHQFQDNTFSLVIDKGDLTSH